MIEKLSFANVWFILEVPVYFHENISICLGRFIVISYFLSSLTNVHMYATCEAQWPWAQCWWNNRPTLREHMQHFFSLYIPVEWVSVSFFTRYRKKIWLTLFLTIYICIEFPRVNALILSYVMLVCPQEINYCGLLCTARYFKLI